MFIFMHKLKNLKQDLNALYAKEDLALRRVHYRFEKCLKGIVWGPHNHAIVREANIWAWMFTLIKEELALWLKSIDLKISLCDSNTVILQLCLGK